MNRAANLLIAALWRLQHLLSVALGGMAAYVTFLARSKDVHLDLYRQSLRPGSLGALLPRFHLAFMGLRRGVWPAGTFSVSDGAHAARNSPLTQEQLQVLLPASAFSERILFSAPSSEFEIHDDRPKAVLSQTVATEAARSKYTQARPEGVPLTDATVQDGDQASKASPAGSQDAKVDAPLQVKLAENAAAPPKRIDLLLPPIRAELECMAEPPPQLVPDDWFEYKVKRQFIELAAPQSLSVEASFMGAIPSGTRHILLVPWLGISGGSERITHLLIKALHQIYGGRGVCVVAPDLQFNLDKSDRTQHAVPVAAINDVAPDCDQDARVEILDRMMKEVMPDTVHNLNSDAGWLMFMERGAWHAQNAALFGNIYSNILYGDRFRLGAFWHLPRCVEFMQGIIADNGAVVRSAMDTFSFPASLHEKFFLLRTPVLGSSGEGGGFVNYPYRANARRGTLWMSRIAREKRIDVLAQVAARMPDHPFTMYGAIFAASAKPNLDWLSSTPNVEFRGRYDTIFDLPLCEFSSYMFTSAAEGMPIALLEAAMLGLPLIAPRVGGIPELVDHETGWLVEGPDDVDGYVKAIKEADQNRDEAARRVAAAQARLSAEYSWAAFHRTLAQMPNYLSAKLRS